MPNDLLVVPDAYIDQQTGDTVANGTGPDLLINSLQDTTDAQIAILGANFLEVAYLMCNLDAGQFSIWEALPTLAENMVGIDATNTEMTEFCNPGASNSVNSGGGSTGSSTSSASGQANGSISGQGGNSLSPGVIAGIAVGAVAGLGLVAGGLLLWCVRKRKGTTAPTNELEAMYGRHPVSEMAETLRRGELQDTSHLYKHELMGTHQPGMRYEMSA